MITGPSIEEWKEQLAERQEVRDLARVREENAVERWRLAAAAEKRLARDRAKTAEQRAKRAAEPQRKYHRERPANKQQPTRYQRACAVVIVEMVAVAGGVSTADILSKGRSTRVIAARHCAMYELHTRFDTYFVSELSRYFDKHHASVIHALKTEARRRAGEIVTPGRPPAAVVPDPPPKRSRPAGLVPFAGRDENERFMVRAPNPYKDRS